MARRKQPIIPDQVLDQLLAGADAKAAFEKDGLLDELKKALAERALNAEIDHHLEAGEANGRANSRNGYGKKTVKELKNGEGSSPVSFPQPVSAAGNFSPTIRLPEKHVVSKGFTGTAKDRSPRPTANFVLFSARFSAGS